MDILRVVSHLVHPVIVDFAPYILGLSICCLATKRLFAVPKELQHIPHVPVFQTLMSFARGDVEDVRIKQLLLPFAQKGEPAVLIYALGRWIIQILDGKVARSMLADPDKYPKEIPPDGLLLWRFVGCSNVFLTNGATWKRQSKTVKAALEYSLPIEQFGLLAHKLFKEMGDGGRMQWDDLSKRYTLDAFGTTVFGHDFNAISNRDCSFLRQCTYVIESISSPAYIAFPILEKIIPRHDIVAAIDGLVKSFQELVEAKKENPGNDMLTQLLEDKEMSDTEYRDNMVTLFNAGHDTTAGALSSLCYFLATNPNMQARARAEVRAAMANNTTGIPTLAELREMPFLQACVRESLRINTPITNVIPRTATEDVYLKGSDNKVLFVPGGSSIIINVTTIHHRDDYWQDPTVFNPDRFMGVSEGTDKEYDTAKWVPFALGPRQCPARNFAVYEQRTLCAMLLNEWEWTLPEDSPHRDGIKNRPSFGMSIPKDLYIDFKHCNKP